MAISFLSEPDKVALSKSPMDWQAVDNQDVDRLRLYLFMESRLGLGDFEQVYAEERIHAQAKDAPMYPFASVADAELAFEMPPSGSIVPFFPLQVMKRCFAVSRIPFESESNPIGHIANAALANEFLGAPLTQFKIYRIVADYRADYADGNANALSVNGGAFDDLQFFRGREWVYEGKVSEIIYTLAPFDSVRLNHEGWQVDFYEVDTKEVYALKGAWHYTEFPNRNTTLPDGRSILSTMPQSRSYMIGQQAWAWLLIENDTTATTISCTGIITYDDATTSAFNYDFAVPETGPYAIIALPLHKIVSEAKALNTLKEMAKLSFEFFPFSGQPNGNYDFEMVLVFGYDCYANTREFHFANSLGGTDSLIAYGKAQEQEEQDQEEYRQYHQYNYAETTLFGDGYYANTYPATARMFGKVVHHTRRRFKVSAGYRSKAERDAARDLLRTEFAFIREGGKMLPINTFSAKTDFEKDGDLRYTLEFEYAYAFEEGGLKPQ